MNIYDGDAHVVEPANLWQERVPSNLRDRAPIVKRVGEADYWYFDGGDRRSRLNMLLSTPGISQVHWSTAGTNYDRVWPGANDPQARLDDMDLDMIYAHVLHPSIALAGPIVFSETDIDVQRACTVAYNDWMSEFCSYNKDRLLGLAILPVSGMDDALKELQRVRSLPGIRGIMLTSYPSGGMLPTAEDDRFWAEAQDLDIPIVIHVGIGWSDGEGSNVIGKRTPQMALANINLERSARGMMQATAQIIFSGIPERFPKLRIVGTETGIGWIPYYMEQTDDNYLRHRFWAKPELKMLPSEYFYRQFFATFQVDTFGIRNRESMLKNIMWSSDYPHSGADWPNSIVTIERNLVGVPTAEREQILQKNCMRAFGLS